MQLVIVESPTKAKTLSKFLGKNYSVEATMGHIKDLPKSKLGVDIEDNFTPDYVIVEKRSDVINQLKKEASKSDIVYIASDPDREGEAIAAHVKELLGKKGIKRIVFHEITKDAVDQALKNPRDIDKNLVDAQIARRVLDRIVGYKLSPLLWKKVRRGLSAGRVQTVAVRLIVEREKEISAFKPVEFWEIYAKFKRKIEKKELFETQLIKIDGKAAKVSSKVDTDKILSDLKKAKYEVIRVKKREVVKRPYPPFTTSTMSQAAARIYGWSAKRTMKLAQGLYEQGYITYHRTDSTHIAGEAVSKVRNYIKTNYGDKYLPENPTFYKVKTKSAQEAHEAIRPTNLGANTEKISVRDASAKRLYELIKNRFVACQMSPSIYDETIVDVEGKVGKSYLFRVSGQIMKFDGWRKLFAKNLSEVVEIPPVKEGESVDLADCNGLQKFTQPPARYNEASLIKTLEKLGIGRPSTYAPIISTIQVRQYIEKKEGKFFATPIGVAVNDFLVPNFEKTFDYEFTAQMEEGLDKVATGDKDWRKEIKEFYNPFEKILKSVEKNSARVKIETEKVGRDCPECKKGHLVIRLGRFGKFISCSRFPDCKYTEKYIEKVGTKCPECKKGEVIIKKSGKGKRFFGCSRYPDCKWASWTKPQTKEDETQVQKAT